MHCAVPASKTVAVAGMSSWITNSTFKPSLSNSEPDCVVRL